MRGYPRKSRGDIHESHAMGEEYCDIRAPAGTPRFYGVSECNNCGAEVIEHPAGFFMDSELFEKCEGVEDAQG